MINAKKYVLFLWHGSPNISHVLSFLAIWRNCRVAIRISNHPLQLITGNKKPLAAKTEVVRDHSVLANLSTCNQNKLV